MAKIALQNISSTASSSIVSAVNANNEAIRQAFDKTLFRDGTAPNSMDASLDMNNHTIINLPDATTAQEPTTLSQVQELILEAQFTEPEETVIQIASQAEAEAGVDNTKFMTPLRTNQAMEAFENSFKVQFADYDYIPAEQIALIRANNYTAQDASLVTAGLQAMHNAMIDYLTAAGDTDRIAMGVYRGLYAVNDELFDETFAEKLWNFASSNSRFIFDMNGAEFRVKNWPSHKAVRTSGWYADRAITDPVPMVLFRWEQSAGYGYGPRILGGCFRGAKNLNDPIGMKLRKVNKGYQADVEIADFMNVGRWLDDVNNSDFHSCVISACGYQPTQAGGSGFINSDVTVSTTAGTGDTEIVASANIFNADHVGKWVFVEGAGEDGSVFCAQVNSVDAANTITVNRECTTNVSGKHFSFHILTGSTTADSTTLTLDTAITTNLEGRYVMIMKAGSKIHTEEDVLVTRVVDHDFSATGKIITLATAARYNTTSTPVCVAPSRFIGKSDDQVTSGGTAEGGHNNDCQFFGERVEFSFDGSRGSTVISVEQLELDTFYFGAKVHGSSPDYNNFGGNHSLCWWDDCKHLVQYANQFAWGNYAPEHAVLCISGSRTAIELPNASLGGILPTDHTCMFYLNPRNGVSDDCRVGFSGFFNTPATSWNLANQDFVRFGPTGTAPQLYSLGPFVSRNLEGYPDMQNLPARTLELWSTSPAIITRDTNDNTRYRILHNGGALSFDFDGGDDGTYEVTRLLLSSLGVSVLGSVVIDPILGLRLPSYTAAALGSAAHAVNISHKVAGKFVWDSTNSRPMYATGSNATDDWVDGAGGNTITPV